MPGKYLALPPKWKQEKLLVCFCTWLKIVSQKCMMDKHEWGKCRSNVVIFRLHIQIGMCVYPSTSKISSLSSHSFHTLVFLLYLSCPLFPSLCFNSSAWLFFSFNSHSALSLSFSLHVSVLLHLWIPPCCHTLHLFPLSRYLSLSLALSSFPCSPSCLHPFCFLPQLISSLHHNPKYAGDALPT